MILINIQDDIIRLNTLGVLQGLLVDKTTKKNIMWATDAYADFGHRYGRNEEICADLIAHTGIIKTIKICNRSIFSIVYFTEAAGAISSESGKSRRQRY